MVKKLLKHEFIYYFRTFSLFLPIVLVISVMARVFSLINDRSNPSMIRAITEIADFSASAMLFVSCAALLVLSVAIAIVRFYKNMYSAEGYLTFTLPVTNAQHIFVKLIGAIAWQTVCLLTVFTAGCIALAGPELADAFKLIAHLMDEIVFELGVGHVVAFAAEILILILISVVSTTLLYYACITVGQTAKKNRILMTVGAYFIYYIATQAISTVFTIAFTVLGMSNAFDGILPWIAAHPFATLHTVLCGAIVISAAMTAGFWIVTQKIMTKKLNLE